MFIQANIVKNNTSLDSISSGDYNKIGGSLDFRGLNLFVNSSYFLYNAASEGAALYIRGPISNIRVEKSIFKANTAYFGGCLSVNKNIKIFTAMIDSNYCFGNFGLGKS